MRTSLMLPLSLWSMLAAACSSTPTTPSPPEFVVPTGPRTGNWTGTLTDASNGQGRVAVTLLDTPIAGESVLTGMWTATFANAARNASGDVSGSIAAGGTLRLFLTRRPPLTCGSATPAPLAAGSFLGDVLSLTANAVAGTYTYVDCTGSVQGTLTLTKQ
jgi:hypothetical protein